MKQLFQRTFGSDLEASGGRPTGFDYLRVSLALAVIVLHAPGICLGPKESGALYRALGFHSVSMIVLPMFFALSGFLVSGSLERSRTLVKFLGLRAIRIYPALVVEVFLSALLLGPAFTTLPLDEYFHNHVFLRYLVNVTGHISFLLPGVFEHNPNPGLVNYQLWTVKWELFCYMAISIALLIGAIRRPWLMLGVPIVHAALAWYWWDTVPYFAGHVEGMQLIFCFLYGVMAFQFRRFIPNSPALAVCAAVGALVLFEVPHGEYLAVILAVYLTVSLGLTNFRKARILRGADYSYGVYLYGWPIQQALVTFKPTSGMLVNTILAIIITSFFAAFSWHVVEKPALKARVPLGHLEAWWLQKRSALLAAVGLSGRRQVASSV